MPMVQRANAESSIYLLSCAQAPSQGVIVWRPILEVEFVGCEGE